VGGRRRFVDPSNTADPWPGPLPTNVETSGCVTYEDFRRIDIRAGTITRAESFPEARNPALKLWIDFGGDIGTRQSSAQITRHYRPASLIGRQVAAVVNFPPRQIGPFRSDVLVLGFADAEGEVVLAGPDQPVPNGSRLF
jgi:tRNA-binding protein